MPMYSAYNTALHLNQIAGLGVIRGRDERKRGKMQVFALRYDGWRDTVGGQKNKLTEGKDKVTVYLQICPRGATLELCSAPLCRG